MHQEAQQERTAVIGIAAVIIGSALIFFLQRGQTFVHIDAIAHVNKARGLWDNLTPGLKQLGSIWLPLQAFLIAPLTWSDALWTTGLAGSLLSAACFVGTSWFLFATAWLWTGSRGAGWVAFLFFALNPRLIYFFTTPMTEPLMIMCAAALVYYLMMWIQTESWKSFTLAAFMAFAGTLTRYEGWAIAAAAIPVVFVVAKRERLAATVLFAGAASLGPMLWMIYNMVYFDDPLMFSYGRGSALDYAQEYFRRSGKLFTSAGKLPDAIGTYFIDAAYSVNPVILWLAVAGLILALVVSRASRWRMTLVIAVVTSVVFSVYVYNLYANLLEITLPGLVRDDPNSVLNVRYGTVLAATVPVLAASLLCFVFRQTERHRAFSLLLLTPLFLPDPIPAASREPLQAQFTRNLFYTEAVHNQSFWMPAFLEVAQRLRTEIDGDHDTTSLILTNTRVVHPVVWATGIPIRRFLHEMNQDEWARNLNTISPDVRWIITEEGDQLWHAQGKVLQRDFVGVASAKAPSSGVVHLYRRQ